jgi:CheY-like chemotaxis protein
MLEELGYRVLTVGDAASALEAIGKETFDLVLSDIIMAGSMDGLALARTMRGRQPIATAGHFAGPIRFACGLAGNWALRRSSRRGQRACIIRHTSALNLLY